MVVLLFLSGAALLGVCLVARLAGRFLDAFEKALWGLVAGWTAATLVAYGLARAAGALSTGTLYPLTAAMWLAAAALALLHVRKLKGRAARGRWPSRYTGLAALGALFVPVFWRLVSTRMLADRGDGLYSGGATLYDVNFHAAVASSFAYGQNFPPVYTPYPPAPLLYPFMPDFLAGALLALGADHHAALTATALPLLLAVVGLVYTLALRVTRSGVAAFVCVLLFVLSGGFGFVHAFGDWRAGGGSLGQFWDGLPHNYASMWGRGFHWGNVVADYLLPQRAALFGVALGLMVLACFARVWEAWGGDETEAWEGWRALAAAGVLAGALPYFHTHSFVAVCLMGGVLTLVKPRRAWLAFWAAAGLLATPRVIELWLHASAAEGFFRLRPGWMGRGSGNWPLYWLKNVGPPLLLLVPAWLAAPRRWRLFYLAPAALFVFGFLVALSPNEIDNLKLFYYWHLSTCLLVAWWLARLWQKRALRPVVVVLVLASTASGVLALRREAAGRERVYGREELAAAAFVRTRTEPGALFITAPVVNHPVLSLAGRPVARGFLPWLWSHGLDVRRRERDVRAAYSGGRELAEVVGRLGVSYVYVGEAERRAYAVDEAAIARALPLVYESAAVRIFDARAAAGSGGRAAWAEALARPVPLVPALGRDPAAVFADFPDLGYFVYRLYLVTYGRRPRLDEFMADLRALAEGLALDSADWDARLDANRRRFLEAWVGRPEFASAHGGRRDEELADALDANARGAGGGDRDALLRALRQGGGRAGLVAAAADSPLPREEYNSAFVLAHFFAYFGRNPSDPPDTDDGGHAFWLDWLNRTGDYAGLSRAFVESIEYKEKSAARLRAEAQDGETMNAGR